MLSFLTILVLIILAVSVVVRVMKIVDLSAELKGETEEKVTYSDNQLNGTLFIFFMLFLYGITLYQIVKYKDHMLTTPASAHGVLIDDLMYFTGFIIGIAFLVTNTLLFVFAYRFRATDNKKAYYFPHNNKLEMIWTVIPTIVLTGMIIYGLSVWQNVMVDKPVEKPIVIELFAKQFKWVARYAGPDNELGKFSYKLIRGVNELGIDSTDAKSWDDVIVTGEFHLPVNRPVEFHLRSQDVLHGAFLPHFRAQMNCVPGMTTIMRLTPTITTADMRKDPGMIQNVNGLNEMRARNGEEPYDFNYLLICNKICGASHYNMQMDIVVESEEDFNKWMSGQKAYKAPVSVENTKAVILPEKLGQKSVSEETKGKNS